MIDDPSKKIFITPYRFPPIIFFQVLEQEIARDQTCSRAIARDFQKSVFEFSSLRKLFSEYQILCEQTQ